MTLEYFLGDHLGSTFLTTDATGAKVSEIKYKPWGEIRTAPNITVPADTSPSYAATNIKTLAAEEAASVV